MNRNQEILLHLSLIPGIGSVTIQAIIHALNTSLDQLYDFNLIDIQKLGLSLSVAQKLIQGLTDKKILDEEINLLHKHSITIVTVLDEQFPTLLKQIYMPPSVLYLKGQSLLKEGRNIAVVGSRQANIYGKRIVDSIIPNLVLNNWNIVSGGALGADTYAHNACLAHKGRTIAVLGSGLLQLYPSQNKLLFNEIIQQGGTIVSPFPLLAEPKPGNFPARNRIIAGLSQGCLVVQAHKKSGARITAQFALDQGREVFAVPGSILDPLSQGCHELIMQGAKLTSNADDILYEFGYTSQNISLPPTNIIIPCAIQDKSLSASKELILAQCINPISTDELVQITKLPLIDVQSELFDLHIEGFIKQHFTGLWQVQ